ncbi:hypothetical protein M877_00010 [Streptomyces niveus NCIMB 11891]|nr:hypothetical protein M877_00010 [Streptomyces niveus NCIMB 11891]
MGARAGDEPLEDVAALPVLDSSDVDRVWPWLYAGQVCVSVPGPGSDADQSGGFVAVQEIVRTVLLGEWRYGLVGVVGVDLLAVP